MSAEAWRRIGSDLAPLDLAWQAWHFQHLRLDARGRRGTFGTSIDVRGSLATNWVGFGAAGSCVAGVTLSAPQARFAWQAWYFRYLHRCPRKLSDELGRIWRRWILRGRRDTFSSTSIDVRGSLAANWVGFGAAVDCGSSATKEGPWTPTVFCVTGVALSACQARFA